MPITEYDFENMLELIDELNPGLVDEFEAMVKNSLSDIIEARGTHKGLMYCLTNDPTGQVTGPEIPKGTFFFQVMAHEDGDIVEVGTKQNYRVKVIFIKVIDTVAGTIGDNVDIITIQ